MITMPRLTADTITNDQIRQLRRLDLCAVCNCGLLHARHHDELMDAYHAFSRIPVERFDDATSACSTCHGSGRVQNRALCCVDCLGEGYRLPEARIAREYFAISWNRWFHVGDEPQAVTDPKLKFGDLTCGEHFICWPLPHAADHGGHLGAHYLFVKTGELTAKNGHGTEHSMNAEMDVIKVLLG